MHWANFALAPFFVGGLLLAGCSDDGSSANCAGACGLGGTTETGGSALDVLGGAQGEGGGFVEGPSGGGTGAGWEASGGEAGFGGYSQAGSGNGGWEAAGGTTSVDVPTWTELFDIYLSGDTSMGHCESCHSYAANAASLYQALSTNGQINGVNSPLVGSRSILTWFGGRMPLDGANGDAARAAVDFEAWVASGAEQN